MDGRGYTHNIQLALLLKMTRKGAVIPINNEMVKEFISIFRYYTAHCVFTMVHIMGISECHFY